MSWIKLTLSADDPALIRVAKAARCRPTRAFVNIVEWLFWIADVKPSLRGVSVRGFREITRRGNERLLVAMVDEGWMECRDGYYWPTEKGLDLGRRGFNRRTKNDVKVGWVYFLMRDLSVCYVGQSINLPIRLEAHRRNIRFDTWWALRIPAYDLDRVEMQHIKRLDPPENKRGTDRDPARKRRKGGA